MWILLFLMLESFFSLFLFNCQIGYEMKKRDCGSYILWDSVKYAWSCEAITSFSLRTCVPCSENSPPRDFKLGSLSVLIVSPSLRFGVLLSSTDQEGSVLSVHVGWCADEGIEDKKPLEITD